LASVVGDPSSAAANTTCSESAPSQPTIDPVQSSGQFNSESIPAADLMGVSPANSSERPGDIAPPSALGDEPCAIIVLEDRRKPATNRSRYTARAARWAAAAA